jgi:ABC-type uncharacterized transport system substrate-binding protein
VLKSVVPRTVGNRALFLCCLRRCVGIASQRPPYPPKAGGPLSFHSPALAAKAATSSIPIVFANGVDPVQFGLVASLNQSGNNVTGISFLTGDLGAKRLGLLHKLLPNVTAVGLLVKADNPNADKIPTIYYAREFVAAGGLMSCTSIRDAYRQAGVYVGKILQGARPAELPVVQSTKFEFVINLKSAKALGIDVPPALSTRADEVIE